MSLPPLVEPATELTADEIRRYSRHVLLPDVGLVGQRRLRNARVLCIGAGGLGGPVLMYLAAAGVGTLGIVDFDTVDAANLQRQVIHGESDIGRAKVQSARDSLREVNPHVDVVVHEVRLDASNALGIVNGYDLVVDGTDNFATRYLVNDACALLGKPYVWGSVFRFDGQASVFWAGHGPCYRCLFPEAPPEGMVPSCAVGGVLGSVCASIGAIQATEAIKLVTGIGEPLLGRLLAYDALSMDVRTVDVRRDPKCRLCGEHPTITELLDDDAVCGPWAEATAEAMISVEQLHTWLTEREQGERDFVLVDVREPQEREIVTIAGSVPIPEARFTDGTAFADLPPGPRLVLVCKSGNRSARVLAAVQAAGHLDAVHVEGGVLAWVERIEPHLPGY